MHAAVFNQRLVHCNPGADHLRTRRQVEVGAILMPRLFTTDARRFQQRHVLKQQRFVVQQAAQYGKKPVMLRQSTHPWLEPHKVV